MFAALAAAAAQPSIPPSVQHSGGTFQSLISLLVTLGGILGALAAMQQLWSWITKRKVQKVLDDAALAELTAKNARGAVEKYSRLRDDLEKAVKQDLPLAARRIFLEDRRTRLAQSIFDDVNEYDAIMAELATLPDSTNTPLEAGIRKTIEESIAPIELSRRRRERRVIALLALLIAINLSPYSISAILNQAVKAYMNPGGVADAEWFVAFPLGLLTAMWIARFAYPYLKKSKGAAIATKMESLMSIPFFFGTFAAIGGFVVRYFSFQYYISYYEIYWDTSRDPTKTLSIADSLNVASGVLLVMSLILIGYVLGAIGYLTREERTSRIRVSIQKIIWPHSSARKK